MPASYSEVEEWKSRAKEMGATHVISVCDTFDYGDYPIFVLPGQDVDAKASEYRSKEMQRVNEIIEIS